MLVLCKAHYTHTWSPAEAGNLSMPQFRTQFVNIIKLLIARAGGGGLCARAEISTLHFDMYFAPITIHIKMPPMMIIAFRFCTGM